MNAPLHTAWDREGVDALVTDRYLESLLAAAERRADDAPADTDLDPAVRAAARVLGRALVRVHPSFRFEERLASRLAGLAGARDRSPGGLVSFPAAASRGSAAHRDSDAHRGGAAASPRITVQTSADTDPLLAAILRGDLDPSDTAAVERAGRLSGDRRPLIVGGAITSAAISLVGVAWVAWRAAHPADGPMARAARTAHARRAATAAAMPAGGLGGPA